MTGSDDLSPPEQITADFESGELDFEDAVVKLLSEICMGVMAIAYDTNVMMEVARSERETKH